MFEESIVNRVNDARGSAQPPGTREEEKMFWFERELTGNTAQQERDAVAVIMGRNRQGAAPLRS
jgi:hypothetical protein